MSREGKAANDKDAATRRIPVSEEAKPSGKDKLVGGNKSEILRAWAAAHPNATYAQWINQVKGEINLTDDLVQRILTSASAEPSKQTPTTVPPVAGRPEKPSSAVKASSNAEPVKSKAPIAAKPPQPAPASASGGVQTRLSSTRGDEPASSVSVDTDRMMKKEEVKVKEKGSDRPGLMVIGNPDDRDDEYASFWQDLRNIESGLPSLWMFKREGSIVSCGKCGLEFSCVSKALEHIWISH
jgi:hypothetical protein